MGYAQTEHPEAVARVMEYLLQPEVGQEFASRTLLIPPNPPVVALGVEFDTDKRSHIRGPEPGRHRWHQGHPRMAWL